MLHSAGYPCVFHDGGMVTVYRSKDRSGGTPDQGYHKKPKRVKVWTSNYEHKEKGHGEEWE